MKVAKGTFFIIIILNLYKSSGSLDLTDWKPKKKLRNSIGNHDLKKNQDFDLSSFPKNIQNPKNSLIKETKEKVNLQKENPKNTKRLSRLSFTKDSKSFSRSFQPQKKKMNSLNQKKNINFDLDLKDVKFNKSYIPKNFNSEKLISNSEKQNITNDMIKSKDLGFDFCLERDYKILGISPRNINNNFDSLDKSSKEKSFCSRGKKTCCSYKQMKSTQKYFNFGNNVLKKNFELIEEILTLFKGDNYKTVVEELLKVKNKCDFIVRTTYDFHKAKDVEEFLSKEKLDKNLDTVNDLLNELPIYVKGNSEYFGNIMCSLCAQKSHPVHFSNNSFNIDLNINSCLNINEFYTYELRLSLLFRKFIIVLANLIKCKNNEYNDPKFYINTFDSNLLNEMKRINDVCDNSNIKNIAECNKMCEKKHIIYYKFPFNIFNTASQSLKILYKEFVNKDIEDFYRNVKNVKNYPDYFTDDPIYFFQKNNMNDKLDLENFKWNVMNTRGMNIFFEKIGDDYFIFKEGLRVFSMFFVLSIMLLY